MLHISAHGNKEGTGVAFGGDFVQWAELTELLQPFVRVGESYKGHRIVVLSACNAHMQKMTAVFRRTAKANESFSPPKYLFCTEEVLWQDAAVGWTLFYHLLPKAHLDEPETVRAMLKSIFALGIRIHYFRWDDQEATYRSFAPKSE